MAKIAAENVGVGTYGPVSINVGDVLVSGTGASFQVEVQRKLANGTLGEWMLIYDNQAAGISDPDNYAASFNWADYRNMRLAVTAGTVGYEISGKDDG